MSEIRIRECPFCGGEDIKLDKTILPGEKTMKYDVGCLKCGAWYDRLFLSEEEAAEAWNRRKRRTE